MKTYYGRFLIQRWLVAAACLGAMILPAVSSSQAFPPAWSSSKSYAAGDIVQYGGNWYRAMAALNAGSPYPASAYDKWELNFVRSNTTLTIGIGQGFPNLEYAWQFARNARIADAAYLHFSIVTTQGDFTEGFAAPFSLDHGSGALISILGDNENNISIKFTGSGGFKIDSSHSIASISNMAVVGASATIAAGYGFSLFNGASIGELSNLTIQTFGWAVYASQNASIYIAPNTNVSACLNGMTADWGSSILANGVEIGCINGPNTGLFADHNSTIVDKNGTIPRLSTAGGEGVEAADGGMIDVSGSTVNGWTYGCQAVNGGTIKIQNGTLQQNTQYDLYAGYNGLIYAQGATVNDPTDVITSQGAYLYGP